MQPAKSMSALGQTRSFGQTSQNPNRTFWPPKYSSQRDPIPEIPRSCVEKFLVAMDTDMDGRVSRQELREFGLKSHLAFVTPEVIDAMFDEIASHRPIVHQSQLESPICVEELIACYKGRYALESSDKSWRIDTRPFYSEWLSLLRTVNSQVYAPLPKLLVPKRIQAQYEMKLPARPICYTAGYRQSRAHVSDIPIPLMPPKDRPEANIDFKMKEAFRVVNTREAVQEKRYGYELATNDKILGSGDGSTSRVNFEAKEYYDRVNELAQTNPICKDESENPIYQYVPKGMTRRSGSIPTLQPGARTSRQEEPELEMKQRFFQTAFHKEDCTSTKARLAKEDPVGDSYTLSHHHVFRELYAPIEKTDFRLRFKCPPPYNPLGISEHDRRPKEAIERERRSKDETETRLREEFNTVLTGRPSDKKMWQQYIKLPDRLHQLGARNPHVLFKREEYIESMVVLARQMRDDVVFGKPIFHQHFKPLKSNDINVELGGIKKPFKVLH